MERFKLMKLQPIWGNRCNNELCQKLPFLPLKQRAVGSTPTRPTTFHGLETTLTSLAITEPSRTVWRGCFRQLN